mmetsp:Transcript_38655/g.103598  ORF Transcript_38655/g.103598 Transcript_38655/m.103598 type:complete len:261 (+) Transcript_38655:1043-1825(+)
MRSGVPTWSSGRPPPGARPTPRHRSGRAARCTFMSALGKSKLCSARRVHSASSARAPSSACSTATHSCGSAAHWISPVLSTRKACPRSPGCPGQAASASEAPAPAEPAEPPPSTARHRSGWLDGLSRPSTSPAVGPVTATSSGQPSSLCLQHQSCFEGDHPSLQWAMSSVHTKGSVDARMRVVEGAGVLSGGGGVVSGAGVAGGSAGGGSGGGGDALPLAGIAFTAMPLMTASPAPPSPHDSAPQGGESSQAMVPASLPQ